MSPRVSAVALAQRAAAAVDRDPLDSFEFASHAQRRLVEVACGGIEVYYRSGNWAGKTWIGAATGISLSQGRRYLGKAAPSKWSVGRIPLPQRRLPQHGWVLSRSYKQQGPSVQEAYLKLLGKWPHECGWINRKLNHLGYIWVKPKGWHSDDYETWSKITFASQENDDVALGGRLDWVHADEPPRQEVWREIRKAGLASRGFVLFITATPIDVAEWGWLEDDFKLAQDGPYKGRLLISSTVYDNLSLSDEEKKALEEKYENDPHREARLYGTPIHAGGACPFPGPGLASWKKKSEPGAPHLVEVQTKVESQAGGRMKTVLSVSVDGWGDRDPASSYYFTVDLASGVRSPNHDPCCLQVWCRKRRKLMRMYWDYLHPYGMGRLAAALAPAFSTPVGPPVIDPENNGGYIDQFLEGLEDGGAIGCVPRDWRSSRPGAWPKALGYAQGRVTRDNAIAALMRAAADEIAGEPSCDIRSLALVECLGNCITDGTGKIVARFGYHDDPMLCAGRALHMLNVMPAESPREESQPDSLLRFRDLLQASFGRPISINHSAAPRLRTRMPWGGPETVLEREPEQS